MPVLQVYLLTVPNFPSIGEENVFYRHIIHAVKACIGPMFLGPFFPPSHKYSEEGNSVLFCLTRSLAILFLNFQMKRGNTYPPGFAVRDK